MRSLLHRKLIGSVVIIFCLIVFSGGFFNKLVEPGPYVQVSRRIYAIDPRMDMQTSREAPRAFLCYSSAMLGVFIMAYSGKRLDNPVQAYRILLIGVLLLGMGMIGGYYLIEMKRTAIPVTLP